MVDDEFFSTVPVVNFFQTKYTDHFYSLAKLEDIRDLWQAQENTAALDLLKVRYLHENYIRKHRTT